MSKKITQVLFFFSILIAMVSTLLVLMISYGMFTRQVRNDLVSLADLMEATGLFDNTSEIVTFLPNHSDDRDNIRVTWIEADGNVLYDNDLEAGSMENHADRPEIQDAIKYGEGSSIRTSNSMNFSTYYYARRLGNGSVLRIATRAGNIVSLVLSMIFPMALIAAAIMLGSGLLARLLTKRLMKPLEEISEGIEKATELELGRKGIVMAHEVEIPVYDNPEYEELVPLVTTIRLQHEKILSAARSRQEFTANVSHELKTPLTTISGYAELIENQMVDEEQQVRFAGEIRKSSERLLSLINDIIRLSELDHLRDDVSKEKADLYQLAKGVVEEMQFQAQTHRVNLYFEGKSCIIKLNKDMIRELIENLCQNAIRYNNPGGNVWVSVHQGKDKSILTVGDDGIGIPKDQQDRIFERFYRVDKSRSKATGGTGLGLAIVKHIVELHDARIYLESEPGKGTIIRVEF